MRPVNEGEAFVYDVIIVGGGILGLSTARQLQLQKPGIKLLVLEKEGELAKHQSGHNSGVLHAGVYYQPGSHKANFCRQGVGQTLAFCQEHDLPVLDTGKLIVATNTLEEKRMSALQDNCQRNGLEVLRLSQDELVEQEPNIRGVAALKVNATKVVDYAAIAKKLAELVVADGGEVKCWTEVLGITEKTGSIEIETWSGARHTRALITCGGLMADRLVSLSGLEPDFKIMPFRGEFFVLNQSRQDLIKHLIYPVPDPALPFLGVHLTRMLDGRVKIGPNALLAMSQEGYKRGQFDLGDVARMMAYPGAWKLFARYWRSGMSEILHASSKQSYLSRVKKYCPSLTLNDLEEKKSGVRAQAINARGELIQDFHFVRSARALHVANAPSPAATAAFPIGAYLAQDILKNVLS